MVIRLFRAEQNSRNPTAKAYKLHDGLFIKCLLLGSLRFRKERYIAADTSFTEQHKHDGYWFSPLSSLNRPTVRFRTHHLGQIKA